MSTDETNNLTIVGIGASSGGLEAFQQLLQALPADSGMGFVLIQHLSPGHPSSLATILAKATPMPVAEVLTESRIEPNHVYVIPPGASLGIRDGVLHLLPRADHGLHHPIDMFFQALAEDRRHHAIGVVLSGTASDGTLGIEAIRAMGGITFAQDATAQHMEMPRSAIASGCIDFVLPPADIAREISAIARHPHTATPDAVATSADRPDLSDVLHVLQHETGVDFTHYKWSTLYRRITRRMLFLGKTNIADYVRILVDTPKEVAALHHDILIKVTRFFRDPAAYASLLKNVLPQLVVNRAANDPVRMWSVGCSTGQEAYSLAMAFAEVTAELGSMATLQMFATDLDEASIEIARCGVYPEAIALDVTAARLQRFFTRVDGMYRINKEIRDVCVFSRHDIIYDPPFSRIDLISCRNLLIYMDSSLQGRVLPTLHFSLRPGGRLWLGTSEAIGSHSDLFAVADSEERIFVKRPGSGPRLDRKSKTHIGTSHSAFRSATTGTEADSALAREADRVMLHRFSPPGVVVTTDLRIVQYRGDTSRFLAPASGKASHSLLRMLRDGLAVGVRTAIERARQTKMPARETGLRMLNDGCHLQAGAEVVPLGTSAARSAEGFLVLFEAQSARDTAAAATARLPEASETTDTTRELAATREFLKAVIDQHEMANQELQSASEEAQAANEELQSANEELETSKEEIQATNEELATVNAELTMRNRELQRINADFVSLFDTVPMTVVMLDADFRVRRYTPMAGKLFGLTSVDIGCRWAGTKPGFTAVHDLESLLASVHAKCEAQERDFQSPEGRWTSLRVRPCHGPGHSIDGFIVTLVDIDAVKRAHDYTESIVATVREPLLVLDDSLRVRTASRTFYETFEARPDSTLGEPFYELGNHQWDVPQLRRLLNAALGQGTAFSDFEITTDFAPPLGKRTMVLNARRLVQVDAAAPSLLLAIEDITNRKLAEDALRVSETRFRRLFETSRDGILILDLESQVITHANPLLTDLLGFPLDHFLGKELWQLGFLPSRQASVAAIRQLQEHGFLRLERLLLTDRNGQMHPVELVANLYAEGARRVVQCNIHDIAERDRIEARLSQQADELSLLHRRKDEFLAMVSHELRSPIAPIANAIQLLTREGATDSPVQKEARLIIQRQIEQLQRLVDDLLEVSRITTGKLRLRCEMVKVDTIVTGAIETAKPVVEHHHHTMTVSIPPEPLWLFADRTRLEQVLANLLTNAAKFTSDCGHIQISARAEDGFCVFRVRDNGVGLAADLIPRVFDLFTQADGSLHRSHGGLGIGLALVKKVTELHGGTVAVASALGQGSEFSIRIPLPAPSAPVAPVAPAAPVASARSLKILLVDDSSDMTLSLSMLLEAMGHEVHATADGLAAIPAALHHLPDLMLIDIGLPGLSGYELATRLRCEPLLSRTTLVALTGYGQETDRQRAMEAGFHHHMVKPVNFVALERILSTVAAR